MIILIICFRTQAEGGWPQKNHATRPPPSVRTASGKKRVVVDFEDDDEEVSGGGSPQASDSVKKRKINKNGLVTLTNGVVSMRELGLSNAVPSKGGLKAVMIFV